MFAGAARMVSEPCHGAVVVTTDVLSSVLAGCLHRVINRRHGESNYTLSRIVNTYHNTVSSVSGCFSVRGLTDRRDRESGPNRRARDDGQDRAAVAGGGARSRAE